MNVQQTRFGYEIRTPKFTMLFGGVDAQLPALKEAYSQFQFTRVKQIHSDAVVESRDCSQDYQLIADSHFSREKNLALCVATADCVPALIYHEPTGLIASVHAGWRGVANRIIVKTIETLVAQGASAHQLEVVIGPHIQKNSFEVGLGVRDQILAGLGAINDEEKLLFSEKISDEKALVDLHQVVKAQLQGAGITADRVFCLHVDTFLNCDFHSHRRDKERAGRQISFICRTS